MIAFVADRRSTQCAGRRFRRLKAHSIRKIAAVSTTKSGKIQYCKVLANALFPGVSEFFTGD